MFKRILLPTDGSKLSLHAAALGVDLAHRLGAAVLAFHAMEPFAKVPYFSDMMIFPEDVYETEVRKRAAHFLDQVKQMADASTVPWEGLREYAHHPYEAIMRVARERKCDLIVMGSHGRSGIDRLLLGSETSKLLVGVEIPVLVCR